MKKIIVLSMLVVFANNVYADNLFQNSNPFPQTAPQSMNNIYESEPAIIQKEAKQEKKSWFRKGRNLREQEKREQVNKNLDTNQDSENNGSFFIFK